MGSAFKRFQQKKELLGEHQRGLRGGTLVACAGCTTVSPSMKNGFTDMLGWFRRAEVKSRIR
jgi:hypothetical protein